MQLNSNSRDNRNCLIDRFIGEIRHLVEVLNNETSADQGGLFRATPTKITYKNHQNSCPRHDGDALPDFPTGLSILYYKIGYIIFKNLS